MDPPYPRCHRGVEHSSSSPPSCTYDPRAAAVPARAALDAGAQCRSRSSLLHGGGAVSAACPTTRADVQEGGCSATAWGQKASAPPWAQYSILRRSLQRQLGGLGLRRLLSVSPSGVSAGTLGWRLPGPRYGYKNCVANSPPNESHKGRLPTERPRLCTNE
jgi:hypothetical protein